MDVVTLKLTKSLAYCVFKKSFYESASHSLLSIYLVIHYLCQHINLFKIELDYKLRSN